MRDALKRHWPEYVMEGALLGLFMLSACGFSVLAFHPASPLVHSLPDPTARRALMGLAMGVTAIALFYSPWGKQSGAHINPAVTLTFYRMRKVARPDAIWYVAAQFIGAVIGVSLARLLFGLRVGDPAVDYAVTMPGVWGTGVAFAAELLISALLMAVILAVSNHGRLANFTGLVAGALVAMYILVEAPLSGMSMNPARTFGSAVWANNWSAWWIYFTAPPIGMLLAVELRRRSERPMDACAKLHHDNDKRCIFCGNPGGIASHDKGT